MNTTPAETRLAQYGERTNTWSTATYDTGTEKALHEIALGLKAEIDRLRAANAQIDRALGETIDDRDKTQEIADKLAYAVAPEEVIGEHSSMNCPWTNARDLITPKAEVDKLRAALAAAVALHEKGEHNGLPICLHCASQMFPPPDTGIWSESAYPCATLQALGVTDDL